MHYNVAHKSVTLMSTWSVLYFGQHMETVHFLAVYGTQMFHCISGNNI